MGGIGVAEKNVMAGTDQVSTDRASDGAGADNRQLQGTSSWPALTAVASHEYLARERPRDL